MTPRLPARSRAILLLLLALAACAHATPAPSPVPVVSVSPPAPPSAAPASAAPPSAPSPPPTSGPLRTDAFGGARWGFVEASSADGRLVVLRRFDGEARPTFGHHGESSSDVDLAIFDRVAGTELAIHEIIDVEPSRRWMIFVNRGQVWLADSRSGALRALDKADMRPDANACLAPRHANFSPRGKRVGWVADNAFRVRDLASGDEWVVKAQERLWRGWPEDERRGAVLAEVPVQGADWPTQKTSCACRWCNRFALSYGTYGWTGPAFDIVRVAEDGSRAKGDVPEAERRWHGKTAGGCTLEAKSEEDRLQHGPWRWVCASRAP